MQKNTHLKVLETDRLIIRRLSTDDSPFMLGLLNEASWLHFIGDRGVRTIEDAQNYILKGPVEMYARLGFGFCIVETKMTRCPIGICGLAKRDYLDDVDIGFAVLPQHCGKGYAYESANAVLDYAKNELALKRVVATTRSGNHRSANLLKKLGLRFERIVKHPDGNRELELFAIDIAISHTASSRRP
jgi:RimJ/RimL family protein N-acetyltransferase